MINLNVGLDLTEYYIKFGNWPRPKCVTAVFTLLHSGVVANYRMCCNIPLNQVLCLD